MTARLRPTLSADGEYRVTMRPTFRVGYDMLLDIIAGEQPISGPGGTVPARPEWTAAQVREHVDGALVEGGHHASRGLYDTLDGEDAAWCQRMAAKLWPAEHTA